MLLITAENKGLSQSNSLIWEKSRDGMFLNIIQREDANISVAHSGYLLCWNFPAMVPSG